MVKVCSKCKVKKELSKFNKHKITKDGLDYRCKSCNKEILKKYYKENKEKFKEKNKKHREDNKEFHKEYRKKYYQDNKEHIKESTKKYRESNKERIKEVQKKWYKDNKERIKEISKQYRVDRKEYMKQWKKANREHIRRYCKQKWDTDPLFKLKQILRNRTWGAFKNKGYRKNTKTQEMLGVDWGVAKQHIERQFTKGMNWENQGEWHIDHIIPLASAKTPERLKKLCHYTNLQPMWAVDNLSKSDSINGQQTLLRI